MDVVGEASAVPFIRAAAIAAARRRQRGGRAPRAGAVALQVGRQRMVALAGELGEGVVFANAARSHMPESLGVLPPEQRQGSDFFIGNMIPTCISDDGAAAAAVNRRTLTFYLTLPNYRNYWKEAGYVEEMEAVEKALEAGERDQLPGLMSEAWLADCTLHGSKDQVREGLAAWYEAGVTTPILVPSSAEGNQMKAFEELFAIFD